MIELVPIVTNHVQLVLNHMTTPMNVLHVIQIVIVLKEPVVKHIS